MVEPPGTAPGSDPLIPGAFIAIVRANPNTTDIGRGETGRKVAQPAMKNGPAMKKGPVSNRPRSSFGLMTDQKPALIASNSSIMRVRISLEMGVWARIVPSTGSRKCCFSVSTGIVAMAASFANA